MQNKTLNLFKLRVLAEVCKTNSYRTTAKNLFITPSAVSKVVKSLEKDWNMPLVDSKGNSIKVNAEAEKLAGLATVLLEAGDNFNSELSLLSSNKIAATLQIGSGGSHTKIILNRILGSFPKLFPALEYEVVAINSSEIIRAVERGDLDCGIVSGVVPEHINKDLIYEDKISLYAYQTNPLAKAIISLKEISYPICLREKGSSTRFYVEQFLTKNNINLLNSRQTGKNDELTDHLCKTQDSLQFLSDFYYRNSHWNKGYVKVQCSDLNIQIPVYFITRKNFPFTKLKKHIQSTRFQEDILAS